ncbi:MAG: hypothetical protein N4A45_05430 [Flavobacteriales bacterium]|jgi:imidazolonepropionase-like amidohydrolase|nr:hypothetical protein [Flavobacteriales bacterium]
MSDKYKKIVNKQLEDSTSHWAGKPRMTKEEIKAALEFAERKAKPVKAFFSNPKNVEDFERKMAELTEK